MDSKTALKLIQDRFKESAEVMDRLSRDRAQAGILSTIAFEIADRLKKGRLVVVFGNGGSAADAQHFAGELIGGLFNHKRPALNVIALSTNTSNLTAIGNDYSYEEVFSRQVQAHCRVEDVAIGITTSGNSKNVLLALKKAKEIGSLTVGLTGRTGGKMKTSKDIDFLFQAPHDVTPRIQESHINAIHSICELVEIILFGHQRN